MSDHESETALDTENGEIDAEAVAETLAAVETQIANRIVGQEEIVRRLLVCLLTDGNALLEGAPGLGKTLLVRTLAEAVDLSFSRIQNTPDLMPSDVTGTEVIREVGNDREFVFEEGPIFANVVLADEINRATPKTQAALLEAMEEEQVTAGGETRHLPEPFFVLATQNPIEQEGTYPLPEAQLDRFLVQIEVPYPDRDTERSILLATTGTEEDEAHAVFTHHELIEAQKMLRRMPVGEAVMEMILDLVRACRPDDSTADDRVRESVAWGPGPRAAQALMLTVRARAMLRGRLAPDASDVAAMAMPVLGHRMALNFAARARGDSLDALIARTVEDVTQGQVAA